MLGNRCLSSFRDWAGYPGTLDVRYASGFVLLCPLYALYLLSVRPELGHFTLYYALPWLLPAVVWLAVFAKRSRAAAIGLPESIILVVLSIAISAPMQRVVGVRGLFFYVVKLAFTGPVSIPTMKECALAVRQNYSQNALDDVSVESHCVSEGVAALIPNDVQADEVVYVEHPRSDLAKCSRCCCSAAGSMDT